ALHVAREDVFGRTLFIERNFRRHRALGAHAAHGDGERLPRTSYRVLHRRRLVAAVDHAVRALLIVTGAVGIPVGRFHQLAEGAHVAFAHEIPGALPAEHRASRITPRRAAVFLIAGEEIEEQARLAERPGAPAASTAEDVAEQPLGRFAIEKML